MRRIFLLLLCSGIALTAWGQEPYSSTPPAPLFLADDDALVPALPVEPPETAPAPAPKKNPPPKAEKVLPAQPVKPAPVPPDTSIDDEIVLHATKVEGQPPTAPETAPPAKPIPQPDGVPGAEPVAVTPPAPRMDLSLAATPATEADHGPIYSLLATHYYDPALFRSAGFDKLANDAIPKELFRLPGVRLVADVEPETHPPLRTNLLPGRIGYWRAQSLAAPHGGWPHLASQLRDWNHGGPAEAIPGLILDLRGTTAPSDCAGAARIASFFLRPHQPLFSVDGPQTPLKIYQTEGGDETGTVYDGPLIVLIDAGTRGAAEALADLLRRERNAILVGQPTAGEAALFSSFPVDDQRVLVMPTAAIRRPNDHAFFGEPIAPDIAVHVTQEEEAGALKELDKTSPAKIIAMTSAPAQVSETTLARDESPELEEIRREQKNHPRAEPVQAKDLILLQAVDALKAITVIPNPAPPKVEPAMPVTE